MGKMKGEKKGGMINWLHFQQEQGRRGSRLVILLLLFEKEEKMMMDISFVLGDDRFLSSHSHRNGRDT